MENRFAADLSVLEPEDNEGYGNRVLPCVRDTEIAALVAALHRGGNGSEAIERRHVAVLLAFAERMASSARHRSSVDDLRAGLDAITLAGRAADSRDLTAVLPLLWRTAATLHLDPATEFTAAAMRAEGAGSEALVGFIRRTPDDQSPAAMGYIESADEFGFHYRRTW